jgi:uncharacterized protein YndB with AHSA1/START domain
VTGDSAATPIEPIALAVECAASPELAWRHLTQPDLVADWFTEVSELGPVGSEYRIDFGEGSVVIGAVTAHEPGRRFAHRWTWADAETEAATLVSWSITPLAGGGSRIELRHEGWTEAGLDDAVRDDHEAYWSGYLDDLRDVLEDAAAGA